MNFKSFARASVLTLLVASVAAAGSGPWLHVEVIDRNDGSAKVNVNLPLSIVRVAANSSDGNSMLPTQIEIDSADISLVDLRKMWLQLREAGDAELLRVEKEGEMVAISQKDDKVHVQVTDKKSGTTNVEIEVPRKVVDALFSGDGEKLNLRAALATFDDDFRGELVKISDGANRVRVWVD